MPPWWYNKPYPWTVRFWLVNPQCRLSKEGDPKTRHKESPKQKREDGGTPSKHNLQHVMQAEGSCQASDEIRCSCVIRESEELFGHVRNPLHDVLGIHEHRFITKTLCMAAPGLHVQPSIQGSLASAQTSPTKSGGRGVGSSGNTSKAGGSHCSPNWVVLAKNIAGKPCKVVVFLVFLQTHLERVP